MKTIEFIGNIPGLGPLIQELMNTIHTVVFMALEVSPTFTFYIQPPAHLAQPYLKPLMQTATEQLTVASGNIIKGHDQEKVFRYWLSYLLWAKYVEPSTSGIPTLATRLIHI